jgi:exopolyphosphatase/guanosine-5'-triphosphate,3'-diphosphate pyrophosphatase
LRSKKPGAARAQVLPKRFAAIDIGTNTILLLVAELKENGTFRALDDRAEISRLGQGVDRTRRIGAAGEKRSVETLRSYVRSCSELGVDEIVVVGTSALRDAANAEAFAARIRRELGLELRVLSGDEEAFYSYLAVQRGLALGAKEVLVIDVGGGSTELIWGRAGSPHRSISLELGSVRLTERFLASDPPRAEEVAALISAVDGVLEPLSLDWKSEGRFEAAVGIAGTFTTLAAIAKGLKRYSHSEVHGTCLSRAEVRRQIGLFKAKSLAERLKIPGLEPKRADVILGGALLVDRIMAVFEFDEITVSDQGIRYGLLHERLSRAYG